LTLDALPLSPRAAKLPLLHAGADLSRRTRVRHELFNVNSFASRSGARTPAADGLFVSRAKAKTSVANACVPNRLHRASGFSRAANVAVCQAWSVAAARRSRPGGAIICVNVQPQPLQRWVMSSQPRPRGDGSTAATTIWPPQAGHGMMNLGNDRVRDGMVSRRMGDPFLSFAPSPCRERVRLLLRSVVCRFGLCYFC